MPALRPLPLAVLLLGLIASVAATLAVRRDERHSQHVRFERIADELASRLGERLTQHLAMLQASEGFVRGLGTLDRPRLQAYMSALDLTGTYRGIQGIGLAEALPAGGEPAVAARVSAAYGRPIGVRPAKTDQADRAVVTLLEPGDARNIRALGFDMFSEPTRRTAMLAARQSGRPRASGPVRLVQEITSDKQTGFLVFIPTVALGRGGGRGPLAGVEGFVYAPFRAGDLHHAVLDPFSDLGVTVHTEDLAAPDLPLFDDGRTPVPGGLQVWRGIDVAGRHWRMTISETAGFAPGALHMGSWLVGSLALLLTATLARIVHLTQAALDQARQTAAASAQLAEQRTLMMREMAHRIKNHIARIQAIARHTRREASGLDDFDRRFSDRLRAMAAAQDLLSEDARGAPVDELLLRELAQVMPEDSARAALSGPPVLLTPRQAQAVALVAHELATNAMKYGTLSRGVPDLAVGWRTETEARNARWLRIDWREPASADGGGRASDDAIAEGTAVAEKPDGQPPSGGGRGFGTQLIEAMVEGDLSGQFQRRIDASGLHAIIRFPLDG